MRKAAITALPLLLTLSFISSCNKGQVKNTDKGTSKSPEKISKEYIKEGFITSSIYRVVITTPENKCDETGLEEKAKMRAYSSLRNLILSKTGSLTPEANRKLRLLAKTGKLKLIKKGCPGSSVYYLDIEQIGLKNYLRNIAAGR